MSKPIKLVNRTQWAWHPWNHFTEVSKNYGKCPSKAVNELGREFLKNIGAWDPPYKIEKDVEKYILTLDLTGLNSEEVSVAVVDEWLSVKGIGGTKFNSKWMIPADANPKSVNAVIQNDFLIITLLKSRENNWKTDFTKIFKSF